MFTQSLLSSCLTLFNSGNILWMEGYARSAAMLLGVDFLMCFEEFAEILCKYFFEYFYHM